MHALLIVALGLFCYSNTFNAPFQWDEIPYIQDNPIIKELSYFWNPSSAREIKEHYNTFKTRYIGYLTFSLNHTINGLSLKNSVTSGIPRAHGK
jgi:hypothetical protein